MNLYKICEQKLKYLNYSKRTSEIYLHYIDEFLSSIGKPPTRITSSDFQSYLDNYKFTTVSQQNQVINSIRFLYKFGLDKKYDKVSFKRPKKEKKLPRVIDGDLIKKRLSKIDNLKHKAILTLTYSVGLRVSEITDFIIKYKNSTIVEEIKGRITKRDVLKMEAAIPLLKKMNIEYKVVQKNDIYDDYIEPIIEDYNNKFGSFQRISLMYSFMKMANTISHRSTCLKGFLSHWYLLRIMFIIFY